MILLIDMDAFFASVHQAEDPALRGKPVLVSGDPKRRHGVVTTASYEARAEGVKPPMPLWEARRLCPAGIVVQADFPLYQRFSREVMRILQEFSPLVEQASVDEAFVDLGGPEEGLEWALETGRLIKKTVLERLGLKCSIGIGENKTLAKMAANLDKPDGLMALTTKNVPGKMWPLPVRALHGVGPKTAEKLNAAGIFTIGDLANTPAARLHANFGKVGTWLLSAARGEGSTVVDPVPKQPKSIGRQVTLTRDAFSVAAVRETMLSQAKDVSRRLRKAGLLCTVVRVDFKDTAFKSYSRQKKLAAPTCASGEIFSTAVDLAAGNIPRQGIRLIGVSAAGLAQSEEGDLHRLCAEMERKFGPGSVVLGSDLIPGSSPSDPAKPDSTV